MRVKIPFHPRFAPWLLEGIMILVPRRRPITVEDHTTGEKRKAESGDHFHAFGAIFDIKRIHDDFSLQSLVERGYRYCGFASPQEFVHFWNSIYTFNPYNPDDTVFLPWIQLRDETTANIVKYKNWCPFCPPDHEPGPDIPCIHFQGYAGQVAKHPDNVFIDTLVSQRAYRNIKEERIAEPVIA